MAVPALMIIRKVKRAVNRSAMAVPALMIIRKVKSTE
jgi:hypothetical protein